MQVTSEANSLPPNLLRQLSDDEQDELQTSLEEVNKELRILGIDPEPLLAKVQEQVNHWDENVKVAQKMDLEPISIRRRAGILALLTILGLVGAIVTSLVLWRQLIIDSNERFFVAELLIGFAGLFILGLFALATVLWTAYVHQSLLAKAASAEVSEFEDALRAFRCANPSLENLVRAHFSQFTRVRHHLTNRTDGDSCHA
jgi:hypothetical protein